MTRAKKIIASVCAAATLITAGASTLAVSAANSAKTTVTSVPATPRLWIFNSISGGLI